MIVIAKSCFSCLIVKPITGFYKHPAMLDGHLGKCKTCTKICVHKNRNKNIEHYRQYDIRRSKQTHRIALNKKIGNSWDEKYPIKYRAKSAVNNARRDGRLNKAEACSSCKKTGIRIYGHHSDYSKPLDVIWLCQVCHKEWHKNNEAINGD